MKAKKLLLAVFVFALCLTACGTTSIKLQKETFTVELGEQIGTKAENYLSKDVDKEAVKESKVSFEKSKDYSVDSITNTLKVKEANYLPVAKYTGIVSYKKEKLNFTVEVKDTTAPKFVDFKDEISLEVKSAINIEDNFNAEDLSKVQISVAGEYDVNKEGTYKLKVTATDKYKNKTTKDCTLKVIAKAVEAPSNNQTGNNSNTNTDSATPPSINHGLNNPTPPVQKPQQPQEPQKPATPTCDMSVPAGAYATPEEAYYAASDMLGKGTAPEGKIGATGTALFNSCGDVVGYTIYWY